MTAEEIFANKKPDFARLAAHGFTQEEGVWTTHVRIVDDLVLVVTIFSDGKVRAEILDPAFGEPYTQHLVAEAAGEFVGRVREAYERELCAIADGCFMQDAFREQIADRLFAFAREKYGEAPEFLWEGYPDTAVLRRQDTRKWYAVMMCVERSKLSLAGTGKVEVADVRADPAGLPNLIDGARILPGWHMNKKHWVTVLLDGTVPFEEAVTLIEKSRLLAKK